MCAVTFLSCTRQAAGQRFALVAQFKEEPGRTVAAAAAAFVSGEEMGAGCAATVSLRRMWVSGS